MKALRTVITSGELVTDKEPFMEIQNLQVSYSNAFEAQSPQYVRIFGTEFIDYMRRVYSQEGDPASGRNYHKLIHDHEGIDQAIEVVEKLKKDFLTRSATIVLADAKVPKQPCVTEINFSIRHSLLHMSVVFKSSDLAKKFIPDMIELSRIHAQVSHSLEIARGSVTCHLLSAQIYTPDLTAVKKAIESAALSNYFKTTDVVENWDKEAPEWDKNIKRPDYYVNIENGYSRFLNFIKKEIPSASKDTQKLALDSGCGTGTIADVLKEKGYKVYGIDISPEMLRFAHKDPTSVQYVLANSLDLPYADNRFDIICTRGVVFSHVGRKYVDLFIQEHARVLKNSGLFFFDFITHFDKSETRYNRTKASMSFSRVSSLLKENGFEIVGRAGTDENRVNAVACKKIAP
jgi:2-polyprenyl-3-methyl-5-hydroxy-6-metoxy-1,4-benzoquinol methylase